jgi:hypothetical protein
MPKGTIEAGRGLQISDLKELASAKGPCLTIIVPMQHAPNTSRQDFLHLKSATQAAESQLASRQMESRQIRELIDPILGVDMEMLPEGSRTLIICRSPQVFRYFSVRETLQEAVTVGDHFHALSFYRSLQNEDQRFFVLALTQKHVRLLRCTRHGSEEVSLGPDVPVSVEQWLNTRTPTTSPTHGATQPAEAGSTAGNFTSTTDRDKLDQHIANFFHRIDEGVFEILRGETAPLVLAGVDYEVSMYRGLSRYPHMAEASVTGSPESLKGGELHRRALEVVQDSFDEPMRKALQQYERLGGSERVAQKPADIVKAAAEARVSHLFIADGANHPGSWDAATMKAKDGGKGDLLNIAALQTIANGGEVWVTDQANVPGAGKAAALLRF